MYTVWIAVSLAAVPMFIMSAKELAPVEDQGVIFGILDASANSTLDQNRIYSAEANRIFIGEPESDFTFQITFPNSGFGGMVVKPWDERKRNVFQILPGVQQKLQKIPGIRIFPTTPPALPGGGDFPVEFVLASTAETGEILEFANQLQRKAMQSGMFAFPPLIDVKVDQPQSEFVIDRDKVASLGLNLGEIAGDLGGLVGGDFVNRFDISGRSYKVIPQIQRIGRLNPDQLKDVHVTGPNGKLVPLSTFATLRDSVVPRSLNRFQQLNAVKISGVADPAAGRGVALHGGRSGEDPAQGVRHRLHRRVPPAAHRGEPVPSRVQPGRHPDLPGAGGAVQQLPGSVRHPGGFGAPRHVRRPPLHVPEDAGPEHPVLDPRLDHHPEHLFAGRAGDPGRAGVQERHPDRRIREPAAAPGGDQAGRPCARRP